MDEDMLGIANIIQLPRKRLDIESQLLGLEEARCARHAGSYCSSPEAVVRTRPADPSRVVFHLASRA
jgi:hypothetical protein